MPETKANLAVRILGSLLVFIAISLALSKATGGASQDLWLFVGVLVVLRACFWLIDAGLDLAWWHIYAKRQATKFFVDFLRLDDLPKPTSVPRDFRNYLEMVQSDDDLPDHGRLTARALEAIHGCYVARSVVSGMRIRRASNSALQKYAEDA